MKKLTKADIVQILSSRFPEGFVKLSSLPKPLELKDMQKAARRIKEAISKKEKIAIVGDYDVDGVVSTALLREFFLKIDYPIEVKIPNRFKHGYGLSKEVVEELGEVELIITVDNGISAIEAAAYCKKKGIDLIITDHHTPPSNLPEAFAIVNPKQKRCSFIYEDICGAQVAWFLIGALKQELDLELDMREFLDLLSIAIIADVMPLRHINRTLVQAGLKSFEKSQRPAIEFLRATMRRDSFSSDDIAFGIAPIINSAGRMEDAKIALDFLGAKDFFEASVYYATLLALNTKRKEEERRVFQEALKFVDESSVIVAVGEDWNEGVVGIVAARLTDRFKKPSIVLTKNKSCYKGSGRSLGEVNLFALLQEASEYLIGFGGHKKAAGLKIEETNIDPFRKRLQELCEALPKEAFFDEKRVLGELDLSEVDWELIDILERFAPYGESNPIPQFFASNVEVLDHRRVGGDKEHILMTLCQNGAIFKGIAFRAQKEIQSSSIDIVYQPIKNIFNNSISIQLNISEFG